MIKRNLILVKTTVILLSVLLFVLMTDCSFAKSSSHYIYKSCYKNKTKNLMKASKRYKYHFKSNNKKIVTVSKYGKIRAYKTGVAYVTAKKIGKKKKVYYKIRVYNKIKSIKIKTKSNKTYYVGDTFNIKYKTSPRKNVPKLKWKSSRPSVAAVKKDGTIKALSPGTTVISASRNGIKKKIKIKVKEPPKCISWREGDSITLENHEVRKLHLNAGDYPGSRIKYKSNHSNVVAIDKNAEITAKRPGTAVITATTKEGKTDIVIVKVIASKGMIPDSVFKSKDLLACKKLMIVAHPDDESLWGAAHLKSSDWFVVCLTNNWDKIRKAEFQSVIKATGCKGIILDYPDTLDKKRDNWCNVQGALKSDINRLLEAKDWEQISTFNPDGVTGHIHHIKTYEAVRKACETHDCYNKLYYFGRFYKKNKIPSDLPRLSDEDYKYKVSIVGLYKNEAEPIAKYWQQMIPYEKWIFAENWGTENE